MLILAKAIKGHNPYKLVVHVKSNCSGAPYLMPYKNGFFLLLKYAIIQLTSKIEKIPRGLFYTKRMRFSFLILKLILVRCVLELTVRHNLH